jgi:heterokaryon incompatibility protein (HET)
MLLEDSMFYGLAEFIVKIHQALDHKADEVMMAIMKIQDESPHVEYTTPDTILLKLENLMIEEFFSSRFQHQPLDKPLSIRLLVLYPGSPSEPLRGTIQHTVVRDESTMIPVKYEAISYSWGSGSKSCSILLDGCQMPLTATLFNALVCLRFPHKERILWADALCINQENNKEKDIQIALMPEIYTCAIRVLVHLGMRSDNSELVPGLVEKINNIDVGVIRNNRLPLERDLSSYDLPLPNDPAWNALFAFFRRPWFLRIWVVQEVVLARDARFFCGDWEMRFWQVSEMANRFEQVLLIQYHSISEDYRNAQIGAASLAMMAGLRETRSVVAERLNGLIRDIKSTANSATPRRSVKGLDPELAAKREFIVQTCREHPSLFLVVERTVLAFDQVKKPSTPILKLLGMFFGHKVSKPQDRLYALVGLAGDINLKEFAPNYEETIEQTNARFSRKLVEKGQGMDVLRHTTKLSIEIQYLFRPFWVPDWISRRPIDRHWLQLGWAYSQYSGGFDGRPNSSSDVSLVDGAHNVLRVSGVRLDVFYDSESVIKLFEDIRDFKMAKFTTAARRFFQRTEAIMNGDPYFTGESWLEVRARTLIADHLGKGGTIPLEIVQQYMESKRLFSNPLSERDTPSMNSWASAWFGLFSTYVVGKTRRGYTCLVPEATSVRDEVFMLQGSDLPFVLRPVQGYPGYYKFLGGCYIHGLMNGAAWRHVKTCSEMFLC